MKTKTGFNIRNVCGENIIVAEGKENIDFSNIISMNESSAFLWKKAQAQESFTVEDLAQWLTEEYEIDKETAIADSEAVSGQWIKAGICEEKKIIRGS